jgi:sugar/nucleoside kinase (ribokinase family)
MRVDVVCAGPPFLDLIFRGLSRIPKAGEEVLASEVVIVPGAMANVAFALRQLDLDAVVCSPVGTDAAGRLLRELMADAGVPWIGEPTDATSVSVGLPTDGDRAFVTAISEPPIDLDAIAALSPRAIVINIPFPTPMPMGPRIFGVVGDPQVAILVEGGEKPLTELRALFVNEREALNLTGLPDVLEAAMQLATRGCPVIVTRGAHGAAAALSDGRVLEAPAVAVDAEETVGAGDLFTAAFIWADLLGRSIEESLSVATAYASRSLARPSPRQKGLTLAAFLDALTPVTTPMSWLLEVSKVKA